MKSRISLGSSAPWAGGDRNGPLFGPEFIVFTRFHKVILHFGGSIRAPSDEGPGSVTSWLDLVLVGTPLGAENNIFTSFYRGFFVFRDPFGPPPRIVNTQGWELINSFIFPNQFFRPVEKWFIWCIVWRRMGAVRFRPRWGTVLWGMDAHRK